MILTPAVQCDPYRNAAVFEGFFIIGCMKMTPSLPAPWGK